ncbi:MAG: transposase [Solobacterium sp.]|nr:transposase [Solobacterium sp.]
MENNNEKKEFTLIEKEDEFKLTEEDLQKIVGGGLYGNEPNCPYCGSNKTTFINVTNYGFPYEYSFYMCTDCTRQFK